MRTDWNKPCLLCNFEVFLCDAQTNDVLFVLLTIQFHSQKFPKTLRTNINITITSLNSHVCDYQYNKRIAQTYINSHTFSYVVQVNGREFEAWYLKVVCFSHLLKCLRSLYTKQCGPRSDCSYRSSLIWVHPVCFYT